MSFFVERLDFQGKRSAFATVGALVVTGIGAAVLYLSLIPYLDGFDGPELFERDVLELRSTYLEAVLVAYFWLGFAAGCLTFVFAESNRWVFDRLGLAPAESDNTSLSRCRAVFTGVIERILITSVVAGLAAAEASPTAFTTLLVAYIGIKSIAREAPSTSQIFQSLHSIWWSSISVGLATGAGLVFWKIASFPVD